MLRIIPTRGLRLCGQHRYPSQFTYAVEGGESDRFWKLIPFNAILAAMSLGGIIRIIANPDGEYDYIHEGIREIWDPTPIAPPRPPIVERHPLERKYQQDDDPLHSFEMPNHDRKLELERIRDSEWDGELPEEEDEEHVTETQSLVDELMAMLGWRSK
ncbi:hypothetical protein FOZ63_032034 [Perkinsus olseni]|uniref:Uncharacterized protein n=1 Tax=Perkinsus olseni TaxID=32597 RepID=A0A7J6R8R1_PEROL|nr:hypothetical protein FOZ63_032034 [Perkinsus olseni]